MYQHLPQGSHLGVPTCASTMSDTLVMQRQGQAWCMLELMVGGPKGPQHLRSISSPHVATEPQNDDALQGEVSPNLWPNYSGYRVKYYIVYL